MPRDSRHGSAPGVSRLGRAWNPGEPARTARLAARHVAVEVALAQVAHAACIAQVRLAGRAPPPCGRIRPGATVHLLVQVNVTEHHTCMLAH